MTEKNEHPPIRALTEEDISSLKEYLKKIDAVPKLDTTHPTDEEFEQIKAYFRGEGDLPAGFKIITIKEPLTNKEKRIAVHEEQDEIDQQISRINAHYAGVIVKALDIIFQSGFPEARHNDVLVLLQNLVNKADLPSVLVGKTEKVDFPIDKVNTIIWRLLEEHKQNDGQISYEFDVTKNGGKSPVVVAFCLDFSDLEGVSITRKLEPFDKRVYLAITALFNSGYDVMNLQQIYNAMGYSGRSGGADITKINTSITKMSGAKIFIDNMTESSLYSYDRFQYDGALLPMERVQAIINGQAAEAAIHIFREPPMVSFARARKQITTIKVELLDSPLSKTSANIELEDYFIEEIAKIKRHTRSNKMLFRTIYDHASITTKKQKQRAPDKIKMLLDHYVDCGYIKKYEPSKLEDLKKADGVTIMW